MSAVVEGEVVEPGHALERAPAAALSLVPQTNAADLVARLAVIRTAMQDAMQEGVDYGVIPGTGTKPTLLKPGAEKLGVLFQFDVQISNEKTWHDDGHLTVISHAVVFHAPSGLRVASGEGICTTREAKYAYRESKRACPSCGAAAIIKGKAEYGGGWLCFKKQGGCGAKYADDDAAIVSQSTGRIDNPDLADSYNTVDKMASKRARIDAILAATGASALFTQDAEDLPQAAGAHTPAAAPSEAHALLVADVLAGIARLEGVVGWSEKETLEAAARSFNRPIEAIGDMTENELRQILAAMPPDDVPFT